MSLFQELKRRNVIRVGIAYVVAGWFLVQVGDIARESFEAPVWVMKMFITALFAGFPVVMFFAWAYEITPDGIKKEKDVDRSQSIAGDTGKKLDYVTIVLLIAAIAVIGIDRFVLPPEAAPVAAVAPAAESGVETLPPANAIDANSIAVLPFVNMSNDPEQEYFSDGISEELLNLLVKVDGLDVASRTSSFAYKGSTSSIPQIASELKVSNVLEGSVRKSGNTVRITAQLIDTTNDRHLWSESYDRELADIFQLQDEIASAIVTALKDHLGLALDEDEVSVVADTSNMTAYDLYLQGREMVINRYRLDEAVTILQQAVALDPEFARAWSALGAAANLVPSWNVVPQEQEPAFIELAKMATDRALALDPNQSLSLAVKAMLQHELSIPNHYAEAIKLLGRAIEADPKNATAWLWRGIKYTELGFQQRAHDDMAQCLALEPGYQNCRRHLAIVSWMLGDKDGALQLFTDSARSGFTANDTVFVPMFIADGNMLAAILTARYLAKNYPGFPMDAWLDALEHPGKDHRSAINETLRWQENTELQPLGVFEHLMLAFRGYEHIKLDVDYVNNFMWLPQFRDFRGSPHFQRIVRELGLPEYWEAHGLPPGCRKSGEDYLCE